MDHSVEVRRCLEELDIKGMRRLSRIVWPGMSQPETDEDALKTMHMARTGMVSIAFKLRAYSHAWLRERNLPSSLPPALRPSAERMFPQIAEGVGIAVKGTSVLGRAIAPLIQGAMSDAVMEAYADKKTDPVYVKQRMMEARQKTVFKLIGKR